MQLVKYELQLPGNRCLTLPVFIWPVTGILGTPALLVALSALLIHRWLFIMAVVLSENDCARG